MSRILLIILLASGVGLSGAELVKDGKASAVIVLEEKPTKAAQLAAFEIQYHIEKMTGAKIPIRNKPEAGKLPVFVGGRNGFKPQEYLVEIQPDKITLAGKDAQEFGKVNYADERTFPSPWKECATLYAAYDFLELAGFRWYIPTDLGITFRQTKNLSLTPRKIRRSPSYVYREFSYRDFASTIWADSNDWGNRIFLNPRERDLFRFRLRIGGQLTIINHSLDPILFFADVLLISALFGI